jgi:hypothetical protein
MRQIGEIETDIARLRDRLVQLDERAHNARRQADECESRRKNEAVTALLDDPSAKISAGRAKAAELSYEAGDCAEALVMANQRISRLEGELRAAQGLKASQEALDLVAKRRLIGEEIKAQSQALLEKVAAGKKLDREIETALRRMFGNETVNNLRLYRGAEWLLIDCLAGRLDGVRVLDGDAGFRWASVNSSEGALDVGDLDRVAAKLDRAAAEFAADISD